MQLSIRPFELPLRAPLRTARGEVRSRSGLAVSIADGAQVGRGEATPPEELGFDSAALAKRALDAVAAPLSTAAVPASLDEVRALMSSLGALEASASARHGIELALLDLLALRRGVPVARLLADAPRHRIAVNALLGREQGLDAAARAVAEGFKTLKLKVGGGPVAQDVEWVKAVRDCVGRSVRLRIDANGAWSEPEAVGALQALARLELELCEQPTSDPDAMLRVRKEARVPIAADESLALASWRPALCAGNVDVVVLKPMVLGGVLVALDVAKEAAFYEVGAYVTSSIDGEVALAGAAHLAVAIPQSRWAHGLATGSLLAAPPKTDWLAPSNGEIELSPLPGLGAVG